MNYSIGFTRQELEGLNLECDVLIEGVSDITYVPLKTKNSWEKQDAGCLSAFFLKYTSEGVEYKINIHKKHLLASDTVVIPWWVDFMYIVQMRRDEINVVVLETDNQGKPIGIVSQ